MRDASDPIPALKEQLRSALVDALHGWSQVNAAAWIGSDQARVSDLRRGKLERLSLEQLVRWIARIDRRVELVVHDERRKVPYERRHRRWRSVRRAQGNSPRTMPRDRDSRR